MNANSIIAVVMTNGACWCEIVSDVIDELTGMGYNVTVLSVFYGVYKCLVTRE